MSDREMLLRLEARDGTLLTHVRAPQPSIMPEIVMWSGRMFVRNWIGKAWEPGVLPYHEAVSITVVDPTPRGETIVP